MNDYTMPTVLIHGFGFDHRIWYPVELAFEGHHVIYLSLPGFGLERITESYSIPDLAAKYWKHLQEVVTFPVHLVGHSMGGYVCLEMLEQQPANVASLALVHSHVYADPEEKKTARTATMKEIESGGREPFVRKFLPGLMGKKDALGSIVEKLIERGLGYDDKAWIFGTQAIRDRRDHGDTLKNSTVPVLMIMGEEDKAVTPELAYKQAPLSERTNLHMYPGVGHLAMYENTSGMIEDLVGFYKALS